jgi:hypothetical protein
MVLNETVLNETVLNEMASDGAALAREVLPRCCGRGGCEVRRSVISSISFVGLGVSFVISWVWFGAVSGTARFEPAVTGLGIVGAVIGFFADREAGRRELREQTLALIDEELAADARVLADARFRVGAPASGRPRVYPRLRLSVVEAAIGLGGLQAVGDPVLTALVHAWRDTVHEFNRRLDLTELHAFLVGEADAVRAVDDALHRADGYLADVTRQLAELRSHLAEPLYVPTEVPDLVGLNPTQ